MVLCWRKRARHILEQVFTARRFARTPAAERTEFAMLLDIFSID
jgi:hypothetical protein